MDFASLAVTHRAPVTQGPDFMFRLDVDRRIFVRDAGKKRFQARNPALGEGRIEEDEVESLGDWRTVRQGKAGEVHFHLLRRETGGKSA